MSVRVGPVHGGFDSLIEEFVGIWQRIAAAGFDVIAFDGPGQGGARRIGGLPFDHDWEKPVGAVLDHFDVESAGLVGISMGGYWGLRAARSTPTSTARWETWTRPAESSPTGSPHPARSRRSHELPILV
jgi:pimeloyl-ACP methyl ester carboxylesterase